MDNLSKKKKVKKPKMPRKPRAKKGASEKKPSQYVNVNVTSSGGGGSGGSSIPSAQPFYNPMIHQSSMAEKEANKGLLQSLQQLTKKQDDISALVRSLEKKPESVVLKEEMRQELNNEDNVQNKAEADLDDSIFESINRSLEAEREAYKSSGGVVSEAEDPKYVKKLRKEIKKLGGDKPPYKTSVSDLENLIYQLSQKE